LVQGVLIPEERLKRWLAQGLLALLYLQSSGVLHRDLKPTNLLLSSDEDLLIGDFGLAALRRDGVPEDESAVGTAAYMSPELMTGKRYTFSTDVWCVLHVVQSSRFCRRGFSGVLLHCFRINGDTGC
jgi:NIMA (never in mitosis gene a)-related kinase 1/4/5